MISITYKPYVISINSYWNKSQEERVAIFWIFEVPIACVSDHVALDNTTVMLGTSERGLFWLLSDTPF